MMTRNRTMLSTANSGAAGALLTTARKRSITMPLPAEPLIGEGGGPLVWIQLATLQQLHFGTCLHLAKVFASTATRRAPVNYQAITHGHESELRILRAQGLVPKAGEIVSLFTVYSDQSVPPEMQKAVQLRWGDDAFSALLYHGLWAGVQLTPRALGFIARRQLRSVVTDYVDDLNGKGSAVVGVSFA